MDNILMMKLIEIYLKFVKGLPRYGQTFIGLYGQK